MKPGKRRMRGRKVLDNLLLRGRLKVKVNRTRDSSKDRDNREETGVEGRIEVDLELVGEVEEVEEEVVPNNRVVRLLKKLE